MLCWVCAGLSFWGAAVVLVLYAVVEAIKAFRRARGSSVTGGHPQLGQPA
jgi:cytochrome c-type biogenesis protein CcmE